MPQNLDICCTTFCAEACSVAVTFTATENVDGSEKMTDKICHFKLRRILDNQGERKSVKQYFTS